MSQNVRGTFATGAGIGVGQTSDVLVIPAGVTSMALTIGGDVDASNTVKTQKSTDNGETWADDTTYNSAQAAVAVTVVPPIPPTAGEQWRLASVAAQAIKSISYGMSIES